MCCLFISHAEYGLRNITYIGVGVSFIIVFMILEAHGRKISTSQTDAIVICIV